MGRFSGFGNLLFERKRLVSFSIWVCFGTMFVNGFTGLFFYFFGVGFFAIVGAWGSVFNYIGGVGGLRVLVRRSSSTFGEVFKKFCRGFFAIGGCLTFVQRVGA